MAVMLLTRGPRNCSCSYLFQCSQFWCPENGGLPILQPQLFLVLQTALLWTLYWPVNKKIKIRMLYLESVVERVYFGRWLWGRVSIIAAWSTVPFATRRQCHVTFQMQKETTYGWNVNLHKRLICKG